MPPADPASAHVAFLGSINVGGHHAKGEQLRAPLEALGYTEVSTFLASGNVIFAAAGAPEPEPIRAALERTLGFPVPVFLRSGPQLRTIAHDHPLDRTEVEASAGKHQVLLLDEEPSSDAREQVLALASGADRLVFAEHELHWLPGGRMSDSELDLTAIKRILGPTTTRTMNTVTRIIPRLP